MDTDLKPGIPPNKDAEQEAIASQLPEEDDPFKPDEPRGSGAVVSKKSGGAGKKVLFVLLVLVLMVAAGGGVYYWQQQELKKANAHIAELNNEVQELQGQVNELEATDETLEKEVTAEEAATTDQAVITTATTYCQASLDPATNTALVFTAGTIGTENKTVVYSTDKNFASLNATCGTTAAPGASQTYYLKNVNGNWVVVYRGATADATVTKLYGIPSTFN